MSHSMDKRSYPGRAMRPIKCDRSAARVASPRLPRSGLPVMGSRENQTIVPSTSVSVTGVTVDTMKAVVVIIETARD